VKCWTSKSTPFPFVCPSEWALSDSDVKQNLTKAQEKHYISFADLIRFMIVRWVSRRRLSSKTQRNHSLAVKGVFASALSRSKRGLNFSRNSMKRGSF